MKRLKLAKRPRESIIHRLVPIYSDRLLLVVTDDVSASRIARNNLFGSDNQDYGGCPGLCCYSGYNFGLFFERRNLCHDVIAHEIFHVTHRILERHSVDFGISNHEPFSTLCGWITSLVYSELARMGERVRLTYTARRYQPGEPRLKLGRNYEG